MKTKNNLVSGKPQIILDYYEIQDAVKQYVEIKTGYAIDTIYFDIMPEKTKDNPLSFPTLAGATIGISGISHIQEDTKDINKITSNYSYIPTLRTDTLERRIEILEELMNKLNKNTDLFSDKDKPFQYTEEENMLKSKGWHREYENNWVHPNAKKPYSILDAWLQQNNWDKGIATLFV